MGGAVRLPGDRGPAPLCPIATDVPPGWYSPEGEKEIRAYKLGKRRWSYNQVELTVVEPGSGRRLGVSHAVNLGTDAFTDDVRESAACFRLELANGYTIFLHTFLCYDCGELPVPDPPPPRAVPAPGTRVAWYMVKRSACCKGCEGPVLRVIQRFGKLGKRSWAAVSGAQQAAAAAQQQQQQQHLLHKQAQAIGAGSPGDAHVHHREGSDPSSSADHEYAAGASGAGSYARPVGGVLAGVSRTGGSLSGSPEALRTPPHGITAALGTPLGGGGGSLGVGAGAARGLASLLPPAPLDPSDRTANNMKDPRYLYLSFDEAGTHVGARAFRLISALYDHDGRRLLATHASPPIRVLANNDVPSGAAHLSLTVPLGAAWEGWAASGPGAVAHGGLGHLGAPAPAGHLGGACGPVRAESSPTGVPTPRGEGRPAPTLQALLGRSGDPVHARGGVGGLGPHQHLPYHLAQGGSHGPPSDLLAHQLSAHRHGAQGGPSGASGAGASAGQGSGDGSPHSAQSSGSGLLRTLPSEEPSPSTHHSFVPSYRGDDSIRAPGGGGTGAGVAFGGSPSAGARYGHAPGQGSPGPYGLVDLFNAPHSTPLKHEQGLLDGSPSVSRGGLLHSARYEGGQAPDRGLASAGVYGDGPVAAGGGPIARLSQSLGPAAAFAAAAAATGGGGEPRGTPLWATAGEARQSPAGGAGFSPGPAGLPLGRAAAAHGYSPIYDGGFASSGLAGMSTVGPHGYGRPAGSVRRQLGYTLAAAQSHALHLHGGGGGPSLQPLHPDLRDEAEATRQSGQQRHLHQAAGQPSSDDQARRGASPGIDAPAQGSHVLMPLRSSPGRQGGAQAGGAQTDPSTCPRVRTTAGAPSDLSAEGGDVGAEQCDRAPSAGGPGLRASSPNPLPLQDASPGSNYGLTPSPMSLHGGSSGGGGVLDELFGAGTSHLLGGGGVSPGQGSERDAGACDDHGLSGLYYPRGDDLGIPGLAMH